VERANSPFLPFEKFLIKMTPMKKVLSIAIVAVLSMLLQTDSVQARPVKRFHTGPYLVFEAGAVQMNYDKNEADGIDVGRDFEPSIGFLFGWNLNDEFSAELQGRYATNANGARRIHAGSGNIYGKYTFIFDPLVDFNSLKILPFVKVGGSFRIASLPGASSAGSGNVTQFGAGPSPGAGITFLMFKYFYFGIDLQYDLLFFRDVRQTVAGMPGTTIYRGGFHPSFGGSAMLGVHY